MSDPVWARSGAIAIVVATNTVAAVYPATVNAREVAIICASAGTLGTISSWPAGFTEITGNNSGSTPPGSVRCAWKRCDGSEGGTSATVTWSNSPPSGLSAVIHMFSSCTATGAPWDAALTNSNSSAGDFLYRSITTSVDGQLGVHLGVTKTNTTSTPGAGWTETFDAVGTSGGQYAHYVVETQDMPTATTLAASTSTLSSASPYITISLSLKGTTFDTASPSGIFFGSSF